MHEDKKCWRALGRVRSRVRVVAQDMTPPSPCRDHKDQMLVELAAYARTDFLVTGDKDLLALAPAFSRQIISADVFLKRVGG